MYLKTSLQISIVIHNDTISLTPEPTKNDNTEPRPLNTARPTLSLSFDSSPISAPTKSPMMITNGVKKSPKRQPPIEPQNAPFSPAFVPPKSFVIYDGTTKSSNAATPVSAPNMIGHITGIFTYEQK